MENQQTQQTKPHSSQSDAEKNKAIAIIGYIFPFLFFIPLVSEDAKKSVFAKFHANQQLALLLFYVVGYIAGFVISIVLALTFYLAPLIILYWLAFTVFGIVLIIMGIINASNGEMKELPLVGVFKLIS